jgi:hypothetical protein
MLNPDVGLLECLTPIPASLAILSHATILAITPNSYSKSGHFYFGETGHFYLGLTTEFRV